MEVIMALGALGQLFGGSAVMQGASGMLNAAADANVMGQAEIAAKQMQMQLVESQMQAVESNANKMNEIANKANGQ
jgi:cephalosporin hydroxylase